VAQIVKAPITVEDVLNSRMIAYPFRLLQCCLVTDGGGALTLVSAERAQDSPHKPVYLLGAGESVESPMVSEMEDFTSSRAFRVAGAKAFAEAGITHKDIDLFLNRVPHEGLRRRMLVENPAILYVYPKTDWKIYTSPSDHKINTFFCLLS
jgi:hypothetical protein